MDTKEMAKKSLEGIGPENEYTGPKMIYDPETGRRIGLAHFEPVQIDTLGYMTLGEKVTKILTGSMEFHVQDKELEFDQEEGQWSDEDPDFDPTNDMLDKTDLHDLHKELLSEIAEQQKNESHVTQILPTDKPVATSGTSEAAGANEKGNAKE